MVAESTPGAAAQAPALTTGGAPAGVSAGARRREDAHVTRVGTDVSEDVRAALAYVLRSTAAKPQTEAEVRTKLRRRDVADDVADEVLEQARRLGAVDDAALARAWVEERGLGRGYGRSRVREELTRREVPEEIVEEALTLLDDRDEEAAATELAERRYAQLPATLSPQAVARRLAGYLARRGHPQGLAQRVALRVSGADRSWD